MTLRLLKPTTQYMRGGLPTLQHQSPQQQVQRMTGNTLRALKKRLLARSGSLCECPVCLGSGQRMALTWRTCEGDHIVPLYAGGTNAFSNFRAVHVDCHKRITAMQAAERAQGARLWTDDPAPAHAHTRRPDADDMPC